MLPESKISVEDKSRKDLSPVTVKMYDFKHSLTQNPWDLIPKTGERLIKVVPTRTYALVRAGHHTVLEVQPGIRAHLFRDIKGKTPDSEMDEKAYFDHIYHLARLLAYDLRIPKRQWESVKKWIKKEKLSNRLAPSTLQVIADMRFIMHQIILVGTTQVQVLDNTDDYDDHPGEFRSQQDLFEGIPEDVLAEMIADDEGEYPLFHRPPAQKANSRKFWTLGTVTDYVPKQSPSEMTRLREKISDAVDSFLNERL